MKHMTAIAKNKEQTEGRIGRESQYIHASVGLPMGLSAPMLIEFFMDILWPRQMSRQPLHFRTSDYLNIHKYCDYFVSIIDDIQ